MNFILFNKVILKMLLTDTDFFSQFPNINKQHINGWLIYDGISFYEKRHYKNGLLHNINEPAVYVIPKNQDTFNSITPSYHYYFEDKKHNPSGPAEIYFYETLPLKVSMINYYLYDNLHRIEGPAVMNFLDDGSPFLCKYYFNNKFVNKFTLLRIVNILKKKIHKKKCKKILKTKINLRKTNIYKLNGGDIIDMICNFS